MPDNYLALFESFLNKRADWVKGLVLLDNLDKKTLLQSLGLPLLGVREIGFQLIKNILETPLKERENLFEKHNIPTMLWDSMNSKSALDYVDRHSIDLIINLRTRCIYKSEILNAPKIGCLNIHHGILPNYKGTFCDLYALTENREAGFSIHEMNEKIDAGKVHSVVPVARKEDIRVKDKYSYLKYLSLTSEREAQALFELCQEIEKLNSFPKGQPNIPTDRVFTKNPDRKKIKTFLKKGFLL